MNRSEIPHWPTESSTGWCTTRIASRCVGTPCVKRKERRRKSECIGGPKAVEKTGERRPWKSQERFPLSHNFNNNKLDDRDHFQQNAKTSVASLRGLIGSSRNTDRHHSGMLIDFIGIPRRVYLADIHVFEGNSGGPLFVNIAGYRNGSMTVGGFPYRLLGVVSGYFTEDTHFKLTVATTLEGKFQGNSGIAMVVPADELKQLLELPELQIQRNALVPQQPK